MSGDTSKVHPWADADVLFGPLTADTPDDGDDFVLTGADAWAFGGILDGTAGFTEGESMTSTPYSGWGVGEIGETRKDYVRTLAFTLLEDSEETLSLRFDTSGVTFTDDGYSGSLGRRDLQKKFKVAYEIESGGVIRRRVTRNHAQIQTIGDVKDGEDGPTSIPLTMKVYPEIVDGLPVYWDTYEGPRTS